MHRVLVTGGTGFIGHHLVRKLIAQKYQVIILDNLSNSNKHFMQELETSQFIDQSVFLHKRDIRNKRAVSDTFRLESVDTCIHLAAKVSVQDSLEKPHETIDVNVNGTLNILQACCENGVKNLVFASSAAVYGHPTALPIPECHTTQPLSPYGASKVGAEALVSSFSSMIDNCQILRFFNVYGEGQTPTYAGVIVRFMERLSNCLPPIIYGDGRQTRDFIHVNDVVRAIVMASKIRQNVRTKCCGLNTLNIGTGRPTSVLELARTMIDIFSPGKEIEPTYSKPLKGDILHSYADIRKTKELLGFLPEEELRSGLKKTSDSITTTLK